MWLCWGWGGCDGNSDKGDDDGGGVEDNDGETSGTNGDT